jgi:hypothetical protein
MTESVPKVEKELTVPLMIHWSVTLNAKLGFELLTEKVTVL